ncbi:tRNA lysidine(34) synthetase TilS [Hydrogenimonas sp. SS33]|uniref:tRNA lysidine(34) synthetase TilS n=1 Tax=Hydrogenimonas leucolamina TaxID=2954236 RepID=UPI00336BB8CC
MLESSTLPPLLEGRNLLAFSGGVDSTALYHLLKERNIPFDIALVNYRTRPQSDEEAAYAETLAARDGKRLHLHTAKIGKKDFEHRARRERYAFFERLIQTHGYDTLITAHQLDDLLEWHLMQLCKGAGCAELVGMRPLEEREIANRETEIGKGEARSYRLVRPLLLTPKERLLAYLKARGIRYYVDESNYDETYTRNRFRQQAAKFLMEESPEGIARSFRYMLEDAGTLAASPEILFRHGELTLFRHPKEETLLMRQIDRLLKRNGCLPSGAQKREILQKRDVVVAGTWAVVIEPERVWVAPYRRAVMPKPFRERCRKAKIPEKVRPYLFETEGLEALLSLPLFSS